LKALQSGLTVEDLAAQLSPSEIEAALQQTLQILQEKFSTDLASAFTLGANQAGEDILSNLTSRLDSLLAEEGLTFKVELSEEARRLLEKGIPTKDGGSTSATTGQLFIDKIVPAADTLQQGAQQFLESNQTFRQASEILNLGAGAMGISAAALNISASESLAAATELRGAVASLQEGIGGEQQTQNFDEFKQAQQETKQTIESGNKLLENITKSIENQTKAVEKEQDEPVEVEIAGLEANTEATTSSVEKVGDNTVAVEGLDDRLKTTNDNLAEGIDLKVDAVQELNVNIKGLEGAVETLKPQFAEVATQAAERVVAAALAQLAAAAGDHESRTNFQNTADGLS
ncbi:hypothetical protein LCGC14_2124590, partial [marine sediment metagenome]